MSRPFAAVLLAGGRSQRMGRDKALLSLPDGGLLWQRQLGVLRELGPSELFIAGPAREGFPAEVRCLEDEQPARGPLGGIVSALGAMRGAKLIVLAVDLPRMTAEFLQGLLESSRDGCGLVPRHREGGRYEPLAAAYPAECLTLARARLRGEDWSLQGFIAEAATMFDVHNISADENRLFANWNTPAVGGGQ